MLIVGVDPGLGMTGVAVYDTEFQDFIDSAGFSSNSKQPTGARINMITSNMLRRVGYYIRDSACVVAIEDNHFTAGRSAQSALKQREVIGAIVSMAADHGLEAVRVSPASAKKAMTGSGKAKKSDMVRWAMERMNMSGMSKAEREATADAMGVCLAALSQLQPGVK